ncbi:sensor histidine kinase [Paenibacillus hodogayensis]|uniref:Sensor histidine kinase n=1 Tax=Paenibacillus hodogayensis TaxID=279208 RepID=A0ABV5W831_9BACL
MRWARFIRESIRRKFIVLMVSVMLLLVSTIGITQYVLTSSMLKLDLEKYNRQILEQANLNINRYFMEYEQAFLFIEGSDEFYQWSRQKANYTSTYLRLTNMIYQNSIQPFVMQHPEVISISLLNPYGHELIYNPKLAFKLDYSFAERVKQASPVIGGRPAISVRHASEYAGSDSIVVLTMIKALNFYGEKAYVQMDISVNPLLNILQLMSAGGHNARYIVDVDGTIVAHPAEGAILTRIDEALHQRLQADNAGAFMDKRTQKFIVFASIPYAPGWKSVVELPYKEAAQTVYVVRNLTLTVTALGVVVVAVLVFFLSSSLTRRIIMLKKQVLSMKLGHIRPGPEVGGVDEVAQLGHAFNDMLGRLDTSIDELARARVREQTAMFTAVQSQIHSHFLYNTLETINAMASLNGIKPIEQAVVSLSSMIRYSSRIGDIEVTLANELEHARHYLKLANIRFEAISYQERIDSSLLAVRCPKLILQPVLENAIKHNVEKAGRMLHVAVTVRNWRNRYVIVRICDDGEGIPGSELPALTAKVKTGKLDIPRGDDGIGLANVAYRIRQFYDRYGLRADLIIGNRRSGGVKVYLILPVLTT